MWLYIILSFISLFFRLSYLLVPLYDLYCQRTGFGGTISTFDKRNNTIPIIHKTHPITIDFQRNIQPNFPIEFKPNIHQITTSLGKPTLAFYTITNQSNQTIHGIRTYNVTPRQRAPYFHKLECFCFDEQRIKSNETLELPILFYIDPLLIQNSPNDIQLISINYTFFSSDNNEIT